MPVFTDATIDHFEALGRLKLSSETRIRVVRYSPTITGNIITLPADCNSIIQITWRGNTLYSSPTRTAMDQRGPRFNSFGVPTTYIFNKLTQYKTIKLSPAPTELLAAVDVDTGIKAGCVITYQADVNASNPAPLWLERRILKYFIGMSCFLVEGKFQNLQVAKYMAVRWNALLEHFKLEMQKFYLEPRSLVIKNQFAITGTLRRRSGRSVESSLINL